MVKASAQRKTIVVGIVGGLFLLLGMGSGPAWAEQAPLKVDTGDTAWVLVLIAASSEMNGPTNASSE